MREKKKNTKTYKEEIQIEKKSKGTKNKNKNHDMCFIYVTNPNRNLAQNIAMQCLKKKLVACANIFKDIESLYEWKGELKIEKECILILKTRQTLFPPLKNLIISLHEYETPCILCFNVSDGNQSFLNWVIGKTKDPSSSFSF